MKIKINKTFNFKYLTQDIINQIDKQIKQFNDIHNMFDVEYYYHYLHESYINQRHIVVFNIFINDEKYELFSVNVDENISEYIFEEIENYIEIKVLKDAIEECYDSYDK